MIVPETKRPVPGSPEDPFRYGWRYVRRESADGSIRFEQIPLTLEDVLHPQEGDQVTHSDLHQRICNYLYNVFCGLLSTMPQAVVLNDVRVAWDVPEVKPHGPDIAVIFGVRERKNWSTFDVGTEGVRPALIVEVTSPETRGTDLLDKLEEYDLAGVPLYLIVDIVARRGQNTPRLIAYRQTPLTYEVLPPDEQGRVWLAPLQIWVVIENGEVACYDIAGQRLGGFVDVVRARDEAEARAHAEAEARAHAEARASALEAELRRLRGEIGT
jgi:hypothetical protein